ncbi:MAG: DUF2147 domain-containing protein [Geminicoccaceae bacterium]
MASRLPFFRLFAGAAFVLMAGPANAVDPDAVIGTYWFDANKAKIQVFEDDESYAARILWTYKPTLDEHNPDPKLRDRSLVGVVIAKNFVFDGDDKWVDGEIYAPDTGDTYSARMWLEDGLLKMRGFVGLPLFGRTATLTPAGDEQRAEHQVIRR